MPEPILISSIAGTVISAAILLTVGGTAAVAAWRWGEQSRNIIRVAFNIANEHEVLLFEKGILHDTPFRQLAGQYESLFASCCCGSSEYHRAAQRLRVALRRVVEEGLKLPPFGSPLLLGDNSPRAAHTPISERDDWEMQHLMRHPDFQRNEIIKKLREERGWPDYFQTLDPTECNGLTQQPPANAGLAGPAGPPARQLGPAGHSEIGLDSRRTSLDLGGFTVAGEGSVAGGTCRSVFSADGRASLLGSPPGGDRASLRSRGLESSASGRRPSRNPTGAPRGGDQPSADISASRASMSGTASVSASGGGFLSRFRATPSLPGGSEEGLSRVTETNRSRDPASLSQTDPAQLEILSRNLRDTIASTEDWIAPPLQSFGVGPSVRSASGMEVAQQSSLYGRAPSFGLRRPSLRGHSRRTSAEGETGRRPRLPRIESASAEAAEGGFSGSGFVPAQLVSGGPASANPILANPILANPTPANPTPANSTPANPNPANPTSAGSSARDLPGWARYRRDQSLAGCSGSVIQPVLREAVPSARTGSSQPAATQPAASQPNPSQPAATQAPPSQPARSQALLALERQTSYAPRAVNLAISARAEDRNIRERMAATPGQEAPPTRNRNAPRRLIEHAVTNATRQLEQEAREVRSSRICAQGNSGQGRGNPVQAVPRDAGSSGGGRGSGARSGAVATRVQREEDAVRASQQAGSPVLPVSPMTTPSGSVAQSPERRAAHPVVSTVRSPSRPYKPPGNQTMERGQE